MRRAFVDQKLCVTCGCCVAVCSFGAIKIPKGVYAVVDPEKCVGCRMCEKNCPASIITVKEVEAHGKSAAKEKVV